MAAAALLVLPGSAMAHGVSGTGDSVSAFMRSGFAHMFLGWDHLLFIAGVLLLASDAERAIKLVSIFALGHSTTLIAATLAGWRINPIIVDIAIALSLTFVGITGLLGPPRRWRWVGFAVLAFGLLHGLGLASRLQAPGLVEYVTLPRVLAFNVGVELAQLFAAIWLGFAWLLLWEMVKPHLRWLTAWRIAHTTLAVIGVGAAALLV